MAKPNGNGRLPYGIGRTLIDAWLIEPTKRLLTLEYFRSIAHITLDSPAASSSTADATPEFLFTGTAESKDNLRYQLQIDTSTAFDSVPGAIIDSQTSSSQSANIASNGYMEIGQSFVGTGAYISKAIFSLQCFSFPATGTLYARIYEHSGTFGTSSIPTGAALRTSLPIDASTIDTLQNVEFTFLSPFATQSGTNYVITLYTPDVTTSQYMYYFFNTTGTAHSGNLSRKDGGGWAAVAGEDLVFTLQGVSTPLIDVDSDTDGGFLNIINGADTTPFTQSQQISYTPTTPLANDTYYWRVRAIGDSYIDQWSDWTTASTFDVAAALSGFKVWNGTAWVIKPVKVWDGTAWEVKPLKRWNGTSWV